MPRELPYLLAISAAVAFIGVGTASASTPAHTDLGCSGFATQEDVQAICNQDCGDPHHLNADHDGIRPGG